MVDRSVDRVVDDRRQRRRGVQPVVRHLLERRDQRQDPDPRLRGGSSPRRRPSRRRPARGSSPLRSRPPRRCRGSRSVRPASPRAAPRRPSSPRAAAARTVRIRQTHAAVLLDERRFIRTESERRATAAVRRVRREPSVRAPRRRRAPRHRRAPLRRPRKRLPVWTSKRLPGGLLQFLPPPHRETVQPDVVRVVVGDPHDPAESVRAAALVTELVALEVARCVDTLGGAFRSSSR